MTVTRRGFLKSMWVLASGVVLAACQQALSSLTPTPPNLVDQPAFTNTAQPSPTASTIPTAPPAVTSTTTPTSTATSTATPTPVMVLLHTPLDGAELPKLGRVSFTWEPFPGAANYLLEITIPSGTVVPFKTGNTEFTLYIESLPWAGGFSWQVRVYDENGVELAVALPWLFSKPKSPVAAPTDSSSGTGSRGVDPTPTDYGGPGNSGTSGISGIDGDG